MLLPIVFTTDIFEYISPIFSLVANACMHFALIAPKPIKEILIKIFEHPAIGKKYSGKIGVKQREA